MTAIALLDAFAHVDAHDFTCDTNQLTLASEVAELDVTTFCSDGWRDVIGGLKSSRFDMGGLWQAGDGQVDPEVFPNLGSQGVVTFGPVATEGEPAYMFRARRLSYRLGGTLGEAAPFTLGASGSDGFGVVRGQVAKAKGTVNATGAIGSGVQLGPVDAAEYLYATFHVFEAGTTITVVVESDDNAGFSSATTRSTIGPLTTTGGTWITRVAGAITDTYYRFRVTAVTGSFLVAGAIGVGS